MSPARVRCCWISGRGGPLRIFCAIQVGRPSSRRVQAPWQRGLRAAPTISNFWKFWSGPKVADGRIHATPPSCSVPCWYPRPFNCTNSLGDCLIGSKLFTCDWESFSDLVVQWFSLPELFMLLHSDAQTLAASLRDKRCSESTFNGWPGVVLFRIMQ